MKAVIARPLAVPRLAASSAARVASASGLVGEPRRRTAPPPVGDPGAATPAPT